MSRIISKARVKDNLVTKCTMCLVLLFATAYFFVAHEGLYYSDVLAYSEFAERNI